MFERIDKSSSRESIKNFDSSIYDNLIIAITRLRILQIVSTPSILYRFIFSIARIDESHVFP